MKVRHEIFLPLQLPPSPYGSVTLEWTDQWGDGSIFWGWRISKRTTRTTPTPNRLLSNYDAQHVSFFDWIFPRIEASLRLLCISYIYITLHLSHFSIFNWNILSKRYRQPCQKVIRSIPVPIINSTVVFHLFIDLVSILFSQVLQMYFLFS